MNYQSGGPRAHWQGWVYITEKGNQANALSRKLGEFGNRMKMKEGNQGICSFTKIIENICKSRWD